MDNITRMTMFSPCTGVSLYFDNDTCIDIDVEPGVENQPPHSRDFSRAVRRLFNK